LTLLPAAVGQRERAPAPGAFLGEVNPVRRQEMRHSKESRMSLTVTCQGPLVEGASPMAA
jgi:hypothetical protein